MSFIIVTRNPRNKKLVVITDGDELDDFAEFGSESDASAVASAIPVCVAWGYDVIEIPTSTD